MAYPVSYAADFTPDRSRLTTFFRYFLAIPLLLVAVVYAIGIAFTVPIAWLVMIFTGRYPEGLYRFNAGFLQFVARINGYLSLVTDAYPPFGLGDADHPIRLGIPDPLPEYSRMKALFRLILAIPVYLIAYVLQLVGMVATVISWFWIVITGKQNDGLHSAIVLAQAYNMKAYAYYFLITETWPPFSEDGGTVPAAPLESGGTAGGFSAPEAVAPASTAPPAGAQGTGSSPFAQRDEPPTAS